MENNKPSLFESLVNASLTIPNTKDLFNISDHKKVLAQFAKPIPFMGKWLNK